ncbi:MAG TPA: XRE family transcriptional regulator, partial [Thermoanaerobaculia bacterium]|nr:XRE family transcriptional regulator [Thermoanaerobaculia bacterium]
LSGVKDPKMVGQWASGKVQPRLLPQSRMRHAYQATRYLVEVYGDETAQAWFFGSNSQLDDEAPAYVLRHGNAPEDWRFVISAAREFVENAR